MSNNPNPQVETIPPAPESEGSVQGGAIPEQQAKKAPVRRMFQKKPHSYVHDVYDARYKHFRTLRLLSFVVGGSILIILCVGMWKLYTVVFTTIADAQTVLALTGQRSTTVIRFDVLETVRANASARTSQASLPLTTTLFSSPTTTTGETTP